MRGYVDVWISGYPGIWTDSSPAVWLVGPAPTRAAPRGLPRPSRGLARNSRARAPQIARYPAARRHPRAPSRSLRAPRHPRAASRRSYKPPATIPPPPRRVRRGAARPAGSLRAPPHPGAASPRFYAPRAILAQLPRRPARRGFPWEKHSREMVSCLWSTAFWRVWGRCCRVGRDEHLKSPRLAKIIRPPGLVRGLAAGVDFGHETPLRIGSDRILVRGSSSKAFFGGVRPRAATDRDATAEPESLECLPDSWPPLYRGTAITAVRMRHSTTGCHGHHGCHGGRCVP
jgi:hypothetical protein